MTRRELERIEIPGEHDARRRTWETVQAAYAEREPTPRERPLLRPALAIAALAAVLAGALSPPGRAVINEVRRSVGIEQAAPALFSLPADGRLLVSAGEGIWIVQSGGSKRLLRGYRDAAWSPFARYLAATRTDELAALEPDGSVRWTLARPDPSHPAWGGSATDTRIAYRSRAVLRVVAGDGTGDHLLARATAPVTPAWRPRSQHVLTYATSDGRIVTREADSGRLLWRTAPGAPVRTLAWSGDGRRLAVLRGREIVIHSRDGAALTGIRSPAAILAAAFRPGSHAIAYATARPGQARVALVAEGGGVLFSGPGRIDQLAWSPDGQWLLLGWRAADQWLFVRPATRKVRAVSHISAQFGSPTPPTLHGWCCASSP